jgi:hypothetical protein
VLIPELFSLKLFSVLLLINLLENILESTVIFLQYCILACKIKWVLSLESELETAMCEALNTVISVVHS